MLRHFDEGDLISVVTTQPLDRALDYKAPEGGCFEGAFVEVPLGPRKVLGVVWGEGEGGYDLAKVRSVIRVLDAVVSNPPYLTEGEHAALDPAVKDYEPMEALVSDADGMKHTIQLLEQSRALLANGGLLAVEIDSQRADMTLDLARQFGWIRARVEADLFGRPRYLLATKEF